MVRERRHRGFVLGGAEEEGLGDDRHEKEPDPLDRDDVPDVGEGREAVSDGGVLEVAAVAVRHIAEEGSSHAKHHVSKNLVEHARALRGIAA
jgi:hypothetical protein